MRCLPLLVLVAVVAGCARPPRQLAGDFPPLTVAEAQRSGATGERVRWGGEIVRTTPADGQTCFEVVQKPLDGEARPRPGDETMGRFIACASGFYDPAVYGPRRDLTVVGVVDDLADGTVGESTYRFPRLRADTVWLWAPRPARVYYADPWPYWGGVYGGYYGPYWGATWSPYPYYWGPGWWGSPYWYGGGWWGPRYYYGGRHWKGRYWGGHGYGGRGHGGGGGRGSGGGGGGGRGGGGRGGGGRGR